MTSVSGEMLLADFFMLMLPKWLAKQLTSCQKVAKL